MNRSTELHGPRRTATAPRSAPAVYLRTWLPALGLLAAAPCMAADDDVAALRQQLQQLQDRITRLEAERKAAPAPPPADAKVVTGGSTPGSFKLPGSDTSVTIGGFVKGAAILSSRSPGPGSPLDEALLPTLIPLQSAASPPVEHDKVKFVAKESRLFVKTDTPTSIGRVTTYVEGDFNAAGGSETVTNGYSFRLRQAWGTVGGLGIGQTWSNTLSFDVIPETIDNAPALGQFGAVRQTGFRWTNTYSAGFWSVALENPETYLAGPATNPDNDKYPDVSARLNYKNALGTLELTGIGRRLRANQAGTDSVNGYGAALSLAMPFLGTDKFLLNVGAGKGVGRYFGVAAFDAVVVGGSLQAIKDYGGVVGYRHFWTPTLRSNVDFAFLRLGWPSGSAATFDRTYKAAHLNLLWTVTSAAQVGVEYLKASRTILGGDSGRLSRLLLTGIYSF